MIKIDGDANYQERGDVTRGFEEPIDKIRFQSVLFSQGQSKT